MIDGLDAAETSSHGTGRGLNITLWVLQGVLALVFVLTALTKFAGAPQAVEIFEAMGTASWMPYVIGLLEIIGAVALLVPRLCGLAAVAFVALLVGAVLSHLIVGVGSPILALVLLVLSALVAYGRRASITHLRTSLGSR